MLNKLPLRLLLTLPYVVLLLLLTAAVGWLSFRAGGEAVDDMAARLELSIGERILESTASYLSNWQYVLSGAVADDGSDAIVLPEIEAQLFHAGALSAVRPSYVFFAAPDGRFVGVQRSSQGPALLKLRETPGEQPRRLFQIERPGESRLALAPEKQPYIAPKRPWYRNAVLTEGDVWSSVYLDHSTQAPMVTLTRARRGSDGRLIGVYGADVPLAQVEAFMRRLDIAQQGLAYIVAGDGRLIASSLPAAGGQAPRRELELLAASDSPELRASYAAINGLARDQRQASSFDAPSGRMLVSVMPLRAQPGLDWRVVVALREELLTAGITRNAWRTAGLAALAALAVLVLGSAILRALLREIGVLTQAAERLSTDAEPVPLATTRTDELGRLSKAFDRMTVRLDLSSRTVRRQNEDLQRHVGELAAQIGARDQAETRLRSVADSLAEGLVIVNRDWRVTYANQLAAPSGGREPAASTCGDLWSLCPQLTGTELQAALRRAMASSQPRTIESHLEDDKRWLEVRMFPSPLGMAVFFADVTQRHLGRDALAERQRQLQRLTGELLTIQTEERRSIARELHDELGQQLAALRINLQVLRARTVDGTAQTRLDDSLAIVQQLIEQVRSRALDLHPAILDDLGLGAALNWLCERQAQRSGVAIEFQGEPTLPRLPPPVELAAFRIAQEAIANAIKHARPQRITVGVGTASQHLHLTVDDDGEGFAPPRGLDGALGVASGHSLGLVGMRERAQHLGGTLELRTQHERGTRVDVSIPVMIDE